MSLTKYFNPLFRLFNLSIADRKTRAWLGVSIIIFLLGILANLAIPLLFKNIVNELYAKNDNLIVLLALSYGCLWVISQANVHIKDLFYHKVELRFTACLMNALLDGLFALPFAQYYSRNTGEIINIIQRTQQSISTILMGLLFYILPTLVEVVIVSLILFHYPIEYVVILLATFFSFLGYNIIFSKHITSLSNQYVEADQATTAKIVDLLMSYETIKYFHCLNNAKLIYTEQLKKWEKNFSHSTTSLSLIRIGQAMILGSGVVLLILLCANGVKKDQISPGEFVLFIGYLLQFIAPVNIIGYTLKDLTKAFLSLEEPLNIIDAHQAKNTEKIIFFSSIPPSVEFRDVNFSYDEKSILKNFSLFIKPAEKLIIMGQTGIGKSTIAKCLLKLCAIHSGMILIDGVSIEDLPSTSIMRSITYCPQDVQLINGSLYENLRFTADHASEEAITKAIQYAQLEQFVAERMNNNIHTYLGERGVQLSGGEKQRIGLARLFLTNPDICILDEPFSAVDKETARKIYQNILSHFSEKTVIIITHQLLEEMKDCALFYMDDYMISPRKNGHLTERSIVFSPT